LWIPAAVNLAGIRDTAWLQSVTVVLKYLPLLFVGVVGWFFVTKANFGAFNASGGSLYSAIGIAAGVALFSFIGVETAAIIAKRVKDPRRNVGRASLLGTGASAIVYLAVSAAVMGLVGHRALLNNGAPFVSAFEAIFPHGALPSLLMLWRYTTSSGLTVFTYLVDLTVVTVAIPYLFSACAQLTYLVSRRRPLLRWRLARDLSVAVAAALFSLWVTFAAGYSAVYQAMVVVLAGIILYAFIRAHQESTGQVPSPADLPAAVTQEGQS
jgi:basic amino acid/polyamine antiporter, APA family